MGLLDEMMRLRRVAEDIATLLSRRRAKEEPMFPNKAEGLGDIDKWFKPKTEEGRDEGDS